MMAGRQALINAASVGSSSTMAKPRALACQFFRIGAAHVAGVWQQLSWSDRLLSLWIIGAMGLGLILGKFTGALPSPARLRVVVIAVHAGGRGVSPCGQL